MKDNRATKLDNFVINSIINLVLPTKLPKFMVFSFSPINKVKGIFLMDLEDRERDSSIKDQKLTQGMGEKRKD